MVEEKEAFVIDDLAKAEWAMKKIAERQKEILDKKEQAAKMRADVDEWLKKETEEQTDSINYFTSLLQPFVTKQIKNSKKKSINLPSGKAGYRAGTKIWNFNGTAIDKKSPEFIDYVGGAAPDFVKTERSVDWAGLKKTLTDNNGMILSADGEILDKLQVQQNEPTFYISMKEG